jgi:hypothetical protein
MINVAVITGDIIHSGKISPDFWLGELKSVLNRYGTYPVNWEIYRGDEFQLELPDVENAFLVAVHIKSAIKKNKGLDVRVSIGIGEKSYEAERITESNGSAFIRSGRGLGSLKQNKITLNIDSGNEKIDHTLNLMFRLAGKGFMDNWTPASSETVKMMIENPDKNTSEIAQILKIEQSAVSKRLQRAGYDLIMDLNQFFKTAIKSQ